MNPEKKIKTAKILAAIVSIAGIAVIFGWIFDIGVIKRISPNWISMKVTTAFAFVLGGITLYFIIRALEGELDIAQVVIPITSLTIILIMGLFFFSALFGVRTGAEDLFIKDTPDNEKTVVPGRPSIPTMFNFILISAAGILTILNPEKMRLKLKIIGMIVLIIGAIPLLGYILNQPLLYYYIEGLNSSIAAHTAGLFVLLGAGILCP